MMMGRLVLGLALAALAITFCASGLHAKSIPPPPIAYRVAQSDCVIFGKVTALEDKSVKGSGVEYKIAVVKVEKNIWGAKGLTDVRVGFTPTVRRFPLDLMVGQEVVLFLNRVGGETFFSANGHFGALNKADNPNFDKDFDLAVNAGKILEEPLPALKSKDADERMVAVTLLILQNNPSRGGGKTEPLDGPTSKLILETLADADWEKAPTDRGAIAPQGLFGLLGLTDKDGWVPPDDFKQYATAAKKWLKEHSGSFRVGKGS
jgi:hypothetical protein